MLNDIGPNPIIYAPHGWNYGSLPYLQGQFGAGVITDIQNIGNASSLLFSWTHAWQSIGWTSKVTVPVIIGGKHAQLLNNHGLLPHLKNVKFHFGNVDSLDVGITKAEPYFGQINKEIPFADWMMVHSGEGCAWKQCTFCGLHDNEKYVQFDPEYIARQILKVNCYGKRAGLSCNHHTLDWLLDVEKNLPNGRRYDAFVRADNDYSGLTNCYKLFIGVEYLSDSVLSRICKGLTVSQIMGCIISAKNAGINVDSTIICDLWETQDEKDEHYENMMYLLNHTRRSGPGKGMDSCCSIINTRLSPKSKKLYFLTEDTEWYH